MFLLIILWCRRILSVIYTKKTNKHKISKKIKNNHSGTKTFWKSKHCRYKISYYRKSKNFTLIIQDWNFPKYVLIVVYVVIQKKWKLFEWKKCENNKAKICF